MILTKKKFRRVWLGCENFATHAILSRKVVMHAWLSYDALFFLQCRENCDAERRLTSLIFACGRGGGILNGKGRKKGHLGEEEEKMR